MEKQEVKSARGGARAGAGRKKVSDRECRLSFGVSEKAKANLQAYAASQGLSLREAVNSLLEALDI